MFGVLVARIVHVSIMACPHPKSGTCLLPFHDTCIVDTSPRNKQLFDVQPLCLVSFPLSQLTALLLRHVMSNLGNCLLLDSGSVVLCC